MAKAVERGVLEYSLVNIRDYATDRHNTCDDAPYGGGPGMLMLPGPLSAALDAAGAVKKPLRGSCSEGPSDGRPPRVIYVSPSGRPFTQELAVELAVEKELILVCGRYEGIDQRVIDLYADDEISVGDYVLSSGEVAALTIVDATYRLFDRVITAESLDEESFSGCLLEYPQWTRPEIFDSMKVPDVLLSGHHEQIRRWRRRQQVEKTLRVRPDLIDRGLKEGVFDKETCTYIAELREAGEKDERN
jgi:tRNA (guanine37-N1)-methyltransferase